MTVDNTRAGLGVGGSGRMGRYINNSRWDLSLRCHSRASLVAQWLRIHLPMQGTQVWALVREDPTCCGATKPICHNYWACALEPASHNYWARVPQLLSPHATTTEALVPRARAPQEEKPPQWEALTLQRRADPHSPQLEKACMQQWRPNTAKKK